MKIKEFFELVISRRTGVDCQGLGPVGLVMSKSEFADLRADASLLGWAPISPSVTTQVGDTYEFGPARVTIAEFGPASSKAKHEGQDYGSCKTYEPATATPRALGEAVTRVTADLVGTLHSVDIRPTKSGAWEVTAYTASGRAIADEPAGSWVIGTANAEGSTRGEYQLRTAPELGSKDKGTVVNLSMVGTIDQETAEKIAEQVKRRGAEQTSEGHDEPEDESIWQRLRNRIEHAIDDDDPDEILQWLEIAQRISQSPRPLGFDSDPWVAPEKQ